jgi:protoheme IX farnesyltransferase
MNPSDPSPAPPLSLPFLVSRWVQFYALTKPRVIQLIVFCALIGMVLAVPGVPGLAELRLALTGFGCSSCFQLPGRAGH